MVATITNIGTKVQVGAAACAIAGAAVLSSGAVASASPYAPVPTAGLGSSICEESDSVNCPSFSNLQGNLVAEAPFQNKLIWFGPIPDPAPEDVAVFKFNIIPLFSPAIQTAAYAWWASVIPNGINFCVLGATAKIDSYSTLTVGLTKGCSG